MAFVAGPGFWEVGVSPSRGREDKGQDDSAQRCPWELSEVSGSTATQLEMPYEFLGPFDLKPGVSHPGRGGCSGLKQKEMPF